MSAAEQLAEVAPVPEAGTFRREVWNAAKRFKSSWTELAALLVKVRREALHEQWGYPSYEGYCLKELHIRKQTALKLASGYAFLEKHEREVLEGPPEARPSFEVVEVLARAEERGQLSEEEYAEIREEIWNDPRPAVSVARELAQRWPSNDSEGSSRKSASGEEAPANDQVLRKFATAARKLAEEMTRVPRVPFAIRDRAAALADDLETLATEKGQ